MKKFSNNQRVEVTETDHPLKGLRGIVRRLRIADDGAWIQMDERPPQADNLFPFPIDDEHDRGKHVMLYPDMCKVAEPERNSSRDHVEETKIERLRLK